MKRLNVFFWFIILLVNIVWAQDEQMNLWENGAPNKNIPPGKERKEKDAFGNHIVFNISEAELYVYLPEKEKRNGSAVIICPGGGYGVQAIDHEGHAYAKFLKRNGIVGIVLKYRLPYGKHFIPVSDGLRAVRVVRNKAKDWQIDTNRIGIAGFSAGGHLASTIGTHWDNGKKNSDDLINTISSRPDFLILIYPVISFTEQLGSAGTRQNLIGMTNSWRKASKYSSELNVTPETPPTFLVHCHDDFVVSSLNSIEFYAALKAAKVSAELHLFAKGGHGFGMNKQNLPVDDWSKLTVQWMNENILKKQ